MRVQAIDTLAPLNGAGRAREMGALSAGDFRGALDSAMGKDEGAKPQAAGVAGLGGELGVPELRPLNPWDLTPGVRGVPKELGPLEAERRAAAGPLVPLGPADSIPGVRRSGAGKSQEDAVQAKAQKWVAQTFYGTLFKQMRDSPFKSHLMDGGRGGQAFAPMLDQHLVDRMAKASAGRLTKAIARRLMGKRGGGRTQGGGEGSGAKPQAAAAGAGSQGAGSQGNVAAGSAGAGFEGVRIHVAPGVGS